MTIKTMEKEVKYSEKKAYEIVYALFRVAEIVRNKNIAEYLENGSLRYFRAVISMDVNSAIEVGRELEFYIRIGQDLNFIHPENSQTIIAELRGLNKYVAELSGRTKTPEALRLNFSGDETTPVKGKGALQDIKLSLDSINKQIELLSENEQPAINEVELTTDTSNTQNAEDSKDKKVGLKIERQISGTANDEPLAEAYKPNIFNGETRQMAIYEVIRQFGKESGNGCRMRDLQESFSGVSERTIRYDLEKLIEMDLIERAGQSGPGTYYRTKQIANKALATSD